MIFTKIRILLLVFVLQYSLADPNLSSIVTVTYEGGTSVSYMSSQPQLTKKGITQICYNGIWVFYLHRHFEVENSAVIYPVEMRCFNFEKYPAHFLSARPIGKLDDIYAPSITFYTGKDLTGHEILVTTSVAYAEFNIKSFVSLNGASVEYFAEPNFTGTSICVKPTGSACRFGMCDVWDLSYLEFSTQILTAKSIRINNCRNEGNTVEYKYINFGK